MIADTLQNASLYSQSEAFQKAFEFIKGISEDIAVGRYPIDGDDIFTIVSTYRTKPFAEGRLEAHKKYTDIQLLLSGEEMIYSHPIDDSLVIETPYSEENDITFYDIPEELMCDTQLIPGRFAIYYPTDGHMPQIESSLMTTVKKVVIKINCDII